MSQLVRQRHNNLIHRLHPTLAGAPTTVEWLQNRTHHYARVAGIKVRVVTCAARYAEITGLKVSPNWAGDTFHGPSGARIPVPVVYINPLLSPTLQQAELLIAHEIMHARWPGYGHKQIAFDRAQTLIDAVSTTQDRGGDQGSRDQEGT